MRNGIAEQGDSGTLVVPFDESVGRLVVSRGLAPGMFSEPVFLPLQAGPRNLRLADVHGDGDLDIAASSASAAASRNSETYLQTEPDIASPTDVRGKTLIEATWPRPSRSGSEIVVQAWFAHGGGSFSSTVGVVGRVP